MLIYNCYRFFSLFRPYMMKYTAAFIFFVTLNFDFSERVAYLLHTTPRKGAVSPMPSFELHQDSDEML